MSYLIIELETQLLKTGKTSADLIRATGHTPANISKLRNGKIKAIRLKTLLDGGCIVIPSGLCLALVVGISLVVLCGISRNISRGVSPFTKTHVRLIRVLALAFAVNAAVSLVGAYGSVNLTIGGLELYIVPHSFVIEICQGATFDAGSFIGAVVCLFISAIWSYASLLQEQSDELV